MTEPRMFAVSGFGGGLSAGIRADSYGEFVELAQQVYGEAEGLAFAESAFAQLRAAAPVAQAVHNVQKVMGPVQVVSNAPADQAQGGQVYQMPQRQQAAPAVPPGLDYPGDCEHGPRRYLDTQTARGQWRRWDCALPWSRENSSSRCKAINVGK